MIERRASFFNMQTSMVLNWVRLSYSWSSGFAGIEGKIPAESVRVVIQLFREIARIMQKFYHTPPIKQKPEDVS
jgi:hypothetical protein